MKYDKICNALTILVFVVTIAFVLSIYFFKPQMAIADEKTESNDPVIVIIEEEPPVESEFVESLVDNSGEDKAEESIGTFTLTAYCNCRKCCGKWSGGPTASGTMPAEGRTIAVDKKVIPLGTRVYIEGYGEFIAEDTGSAIKGNRIDIYMDSHYEARNFAGGNGSCKREVWIVE